MTSVAKEKSEICHISFTFPITLANENFNLAGALLSNGHHAQLTVSITYEVILLGAKLNLAILSVYSLLEIRV
jgi:hypothetical protein